MSDDRIVEELHRHREELFRECGNDPEALVRYLQEKERTSQRPAGRGHHTGQDGDAGLEAAAPDPALSGQPEPQR